MIVVTEGLRNSRNNIITLSWLGLTTLENTEGLKVGHCSISIEMWESNGLIRGPDGVCIEPLLRRNRSELPRPDPGVFINDELYRLEYNVRAGVLQMEADPADEEELGAVWVAFSTGDSSENWVTL